MNTLQNIIIEILDSTPRERWQDDGWWKVKMWNGNHTPPLKEADLRVIFDEVVSEIESQNISDVEDDSDKKTSIRSNKKSEKDRFAVSTILQNGQIIELVYSEENRETKFAVYDGDNVDYVGRIEALNLSPYPAMNHLISKKVVRFPSKAEEYDSDKELIQAIQEFIHKYLDISPFFERIATYYALFTWIYDRFNELPYLRALGDYGSGKSRFLQVIGSICYKPIFAGGATTTSPIFRIIDDFRGTLVLDEADYRFSDTTTDITKILNSGYQKGSPVLRSEGKGIFEIKSYDVFCPKIIATRKLFGDPALESRFIIEEMDKKNLREDIPINLPEDFEQETLSLRNKLLMWRFRNFKGAGLKQEVIDRTLEPRLNQIIMPILSIIKDDEIKSELKCFIKSYNAQLVVDRGMGLESEVLESILICIASGYPEPLVKQITNTYNANQGDNDRDKLTYKKVGGIIRKSLKLKPRRSNEGFVVSELENRGKLNSLKRKFGIEDRAPVVNNMNVVNVVENKETESKEGEIDVSKIDFSFK